VLSVTNAIYVGHSAIACPAEAFVSCFASLYVFLASLCVVRCVNHFLLSLALIGSPIWTGEKPRPAEDGMTPFFSLIMDATHALVLRM
jgi:hypothetical protein